jgi:pimeloyl-ACP methyl ester carboxylesterase
MQALDQQRSHPDDAVELAPSHAPEPAVEAQPAGRQVPPAAGFAELTGQPAVAKVDPAKADPAKAEAVKPEDQPLTNADAVVEQLAHGMVDKDLDAKDEHFLQVNGYEALPIIRGIHEFVMRTFLPTQSGKPPVVAFRGTVPTKIQTVIADLDPTGIGMYQFNPNRALIDGQMAAAATHGQVISAGHSLGGALAQIAAATFPDRVQRIVTFQAPGISKEMAAQLVKYNAEHPDAEIESSHHRVKGDLVPLGGEALTPGVIHNHKMTDGNLFQKNPIAKHTSMPLADEELAAGHDVPIHDDRQMQETGDVSTDHDNANKNQFVEHLRTGLGKLVYGVGNLQP